MTAATNWSKLNFSTGLDDGTVAVVSAVLAASGELWSDSLL